MIRKKTSKKEIEFNMTALPDIVFMLLFFFMVVTVLREDDTRIAIDMPYATHTDVMDGDDSTIQLSMTVDENQEIIYFLEGGEYKGLENLRSNISKLKIRHIADPDISVKIKIDKNIAMKHVNEVKSILQEYQFYKVAYMIQRKKS